MDTRQLVGEVLAGQLKIPPADIKDGSLLVEDLGLDSVEALDLLFALEARFDIKIPDETVGTLNTVADVVRLVARCQRDESMQS
jgi:acyl carrier protein